MSIHAGFDLGGTALKYGLVDDQGKVIIESEVETPKDVGKLLQILNEVWTALKASNRNRIESAGFGFPGIYSKKKQRILQSPNYPGIDNVALYPALSRFIDVPFCVNNDANLAAFGEYSCGAGKTVNS